MVINNALDLPLKLNVCKAPPYIKASQHLHMEQFGTEGFYVKTYRLRKTQQA